MSASQGPAVSSRLVPAGGSHVQWKPTGLAVQNGLKKQACQVWKCKGTHAKEPMQDVQTCIKYIPRENPGSLPRGPLTFSIPAPSGLLGVKKSALGNSEKPSHQTYRTFSQKVPRVCLENQSGVLKLSDLLLRTQVQWITLYPNQSKMKQNKKHLVKRNYGSDNSEEQSLLFYFKDTCRVFTCLLCSRAFF